MSKLAAAGVAATALVGSALVAVGVAVESGASTAHAAAPPKTRAAHPALTPGQRDELAHGVKIDAYEVCLTDVQSCVDRGVLVFSRSRAQGTGVLQGHNWAGWQWLSDVPTGTVVTVTGGPAAGRYEVTGHAHTADQGGEYPDFRGAPLALQTCVGSGTGFTLLRRV